MKDRSEDIEAAVAAEETAAVAAEEITPAVPEKTAEQWAEDKKMLPRYHATSLGDRLNPLYWKFHAARDHMKWKDGQTMTEADFDAGVEAQDKLRHG